MSKAQDKQRMANIQAINSSGRNINPSTKEKTEKNKISVKYNNTVKALVYDELRQALLSPDKRGTAFYNDFIKNYLAEAQSNPNSKAAETIAKSLFNENILDGLDEQADKLMSRDLDFSRYRIIKKLYDKERELVYDTEHCRKIACATSRRCGKSFTADALAIYTALKPRTRTLIVGLTFSAVVKQHWDNIVNIADEIGLNITRSSKTEGIIEFYNKSSIQLCGCPNKEAPDKLRGDDLHLAIIDEAGHQKYGLKYMVEEVIQPMLNHEDSKLLLIGTPPRAPGHYFEQCYNNPSFHKAHWTAVDNPYIYDFNAMIDEVCTQKGVTRNDPLIKREYMGEFVYDTEAQVYRGYKTYETIPNDFKPTEAYIGIDWGHGDANAIITLLSDKKAKKAYVVQEDKFSGADTDEQQFRVFSAIDWLFVHYPQLITIRMVSDTNEPALVQNINKMLRRNSKYNNISVEKAYKNDKMLQLAETATACRNGTIFIPKGGILEDEFNRILYVRDEETDAILPELDEEAFHGDANMALQYAARNMLLSYENKHKEPNKVEYISNGPVKYQIISDEEDDNSISQTDGGIIG